MPEYEEDEYEDDNINDKNENKSKYLGIMFNCCNAYGRIYKTRDGKAYAGHCPKCMRQIRIKVGEGGTDTRFFNAQWD